MKFFAVITTFALLACFTQVLLAQNEEVQILSISRNPLDNGRDRDSSLEGGTLFYVKGTGFDTQMSDNNHVYVGSSKVDVESVNDVFLTFYSPAMEKQGSYQVKIVVNQNGKDVESVCKTTCVIAYSPGQRIVISGAGFSKFPEEVEVRVGGVPCRVLRTSVSEIECEVDQVKAPIVASAPIVDHAGLRRRTYDGSGSNQHYLDIPRGTFRNALWGLTNLRLPPLINDTYSFEFELPFETNVQLPTVNVLDGFFRPPKTGNYRFFVSGDDQVELWISKVPNSKNVSNLSLVAFVYSYTAFGNLFQNASQISEYLALEEGKDYYIQGFHSDKGGESHLTVAVEIPEERPDQENTLDEVQEFAIYSVTKGNTIEIKVWGWNRGEWQIANSDKKGYAYSRNLKRDATANDVANALRSIRYDKNLEVKAEKLNAAGEKINEKSAASEVAGYVYTVTFQSYQSEFTLPFLKVISSDKNPSFFTQIVQAQSEPTSGNYTISIGEKKVGPFDYNTPWDQIKSNLIASFPEYFNEFTEFWGWSDPLKGIGIKIRYRNNRGNVPSLRIGDANLRGGFEGSKPSVVVTTVNEGSYNLFYEPIPSDFLFRENQKLQVSVKINGALGVCPNNNCHYEFLQAGIAVVQDVIVSNANVSVTLLNYQEANITLKNLRVFYGGQKCTVYDLNLPTISCVLPKNPDGVAKIEAGKPIRVLVGNVGLAILSSKASSALPKPKINSIDNRKCTSKGGLVTKIQGENLPISPNIDLKIRVGKSYAKILQVSNQELEIEVPQKIDSSAITLEYNGVESNVFNGFSYDDSSAPLITEIKPKSSSPSVKQDVIITGKGFGNDKSLIQVKLESKIGADEYDLTVLYVSDTRIVAILGGGHAGEYTLEVNKAGVGKAVASNVNSNLFKYEIILETISPLRGTYNGGTIITIIGRNFSPNPNQNQVFIGEENLMCKVISSTSTEIQCRTPAVPSSYYEKWHDVVVTQRIVDEAVSLNPDLARFFFYKQAAPEIIFEDGVIVPVEAGQVVKLTGRNLETSLTPQIFIGKEKVHVQDFTASSISFIFPVLPAGSYELTSVYLFNTGFANFTGKIQFANQIKLTSLSRNKTGQGGNIFEVKGNGFSDDLSVVVSLGGGNNFVRGITIISRSTQSITFRTPIHGKNNEVYQVNLRTAAGILHTCSDCKFTVFNALTPSISYISNYEIVNAAEIRIDLKGRNFDIGRIQSVELHSCVNRHTQNENFLFTDQIYIGTVLSSDKFSMNVTFSNVPSGRFRLFVRFEGDIGFAFIHDTINKDIVLSLENVNVPVQAQSSYLGGGYVNVDGTRFPSTDYFNKCSENQITVCGKPCSEVTSIGSTISCRVPSFLTKDIQTRFDLQSEEKLAILDTFSNLNRKDVEALVFDGKKGTIYDARTSNTHCFIGARVTNEGYIAQVTKIRFFPRIGQALSLYVGLFFQGSLDGINYDNIFQINDNIRQGWNHWEAKSQILNYKFLRVSSLSSGSLSGCQFADIEFEGFVFYDSDTTGKNSFECPVNVTINGVSKVVPNGVLYSDSLTPMVREISPDMGSTLGGDTLTITGQNFGTEPSNIKILIDKIPCAVVSVSDSEIRCVNGPRPNFTEPSISLEVNGNIASIEESADFSYIDLWSKSSTWGGETPPRDGDSVFIPPGQNILLDVSTPLLFTVIVEGHLVFKDTDLKFDASYVIVRGGSVRIGTWDKPFKSKLTITMHGHKKSKYLPEFGNKGFAVHKGVLDIHGVPRVPTWTLLAATAEVGSNMILVSENVDWVAGDRIVIASTDLGHKNAEQRIVVKVTSGLLIELDEPLNFKHYSEVENYGERQFPMRAEVGLLSRNIIFQGSIEEGSTEDLHGAHLMIHREGNIGRVSYTEFQHVGQGTILGRYPIHFHRVGDCHECFVIGNAVHDSFARVVTIHGTNYLTVQKNVGYNVFGHMYFVEDGIEENNLIEDNLGLVTKEMFSLHASDQHCATFWITHPNNVVRRNRAGGSDWYGFWYELVMELNAPSYTPEVCPSGEPLGQFSDNVAHSNGRFGFRVFEFAPRKFPCRAPSNTNLPVPATFQNFQTWKNREAGVKAFHLGAVEFKNFMIADSLLAGIDIGQSNLGPIDSSKVTQFLIVGTSNGNPEPAIAYNKTRGMITPRSDGLLVSDVEFFNYENKGMTVFETCSRCDNPCVRITGGKITRFNKIKYNNVKSMIRYAGLKKEIYEDQDGSLTEQANSGSVTHYYPHLDGTTFCRRDHTRWMNSIVCDSNVQLKSIMFRNFVPEELFFGSMIKILRIDNGKEIDPGLSQPEDYTVDYMPKILTDTPNTFAFPFMTGFKYNVHWNRGIDFDKVNLRITPYWNDKEGPVLLRFNYSDVREKFIVTREGLNTSINSTLGVIDVTSTDLVRGDYSVDYEKEYLTLNIDGKQKGAVGITGVRCVETCEKFKKVENNEESFVRVWSNASQWPGERLPVAGESVTVPENWNLVLDIDPPALNWLTINGKVSFDPNRAESKLTANIIWIKSGKLLAGTPEQPFSNKILVTMTGKKYDPALMIDPGVEGGNKVIAVTGQLAFYGVEPKIVWTRLAQYANAGDNFISLSEQADWKAGDEIVIGPTGFNPRESEKRKIIKVEGSRLTLDRALEYDHYGDPEVTKRTPFGVLDMRAGVGLLSRNIKITSDRVENWGARLLVYQYQETIFQRRGNLILAGVEIEYGGQYDTLNGAIDLEKVGEGPASIIRKSSIHSALGWCFGADRVNNLQVVENVVFDCEKFNIKVINSNNYVVENNLLLGARDRPLFVNKELYDPISGIDSSVISPTAKFTITKNLIQGSCGFGVVLAAPPCNTPHGFIDNTVGSSVYGFLLSNNHACVAMTDLVAYRTEAGLFGHPDTPQVNISRVVLAENKVHFNTWTGKDGLELNQYHQNMFVTALAIPGCPKCYKDPSQFSGQVAGFFSPSIIASRFPIIMKPHFKLMVVCKASPPDAKTWVTNVIFENFRIDYSNHEVPHWRGVTSNTVYTTYDTSPDLGADQILKNTVCNGCQPEALAFFQTPNPKQIGWKSGCGELVCTGKRNIMITDEDGLFLGRRGQIIPNYEGFKKLPGCQEVAGTNAFHCGSVQVGKLLFESLDVNRISRLIAPVNISSTNVHNVVNQWREWAWEGDEPLDRRIPRFWGIIELNTRVELQVRGLLPNNFRFKLENSYNTKNFAIIKIWYKMPETVEVYNNDLLVKSFRLEEKIDLGAKSNICGANTWDWKTQTIEFVVTNDPKCIVYLKRTSSVRVSVRMDVNVQDFYNNNGGADMLDKIAAYLGIDTSRLRIVSIRKEGSGTELDFTIADRTESVPKAPLQELVAAEAVALSQSIPVLEEVVTNSLEAADINQNLKDVAEKVKKGVLTHEIELNAKIRSVKTEVNVIGEENGQLVSSTVKSGRRMLEVNEKAMYNNEISFVLKLTMIFCLVAVLAFTAYKLLSSRGKNAVPSESPARWGVGV